MCTETLLDYQLKTAKKLIMLDMADLGLANQRIFQKNQKATPKKWVYRGRGVIL